MEPVSKKRFAEKIEENIQQWMLQKRSERIMSGTRAKLPIHGWYKEERITFQTQIK